MTGVGSDLAGTTRRRLSLECYEPAKGHDKVYHLVLQEVDTDKFEVYAYWGRRGATLQNQKKTRMPSSRYAADALINQLFNEKASKGYKVTDDESFARTPRAAEPEPTWVGKKEEPAEVEESPQWTSRDFARNPIQPKKAESQYLAASVQAPDNCLMVIPQGQRLIVHVGKTGIEAFSPRGSAEVMPAPMQEDLIDLEPPLTLDGVWNGLEYLVFDAPAPDMEYKDRYERLFELLDGTVGDRVRIADVHFSDGEKAQCLREAREANAPGVWVRDGKVDNHPGQSDARWLQFEFSPRAVLVVMSLNGKCELGVDDGLGMIKVAELPGDKVHAKVGDVVEVEYDSWPGHGKLMQAPRILGKRDDVSPNECDVEQLALHQ